MAPLLTFIVMLIDFYTIIVVANVIVSWLIVFEVINRRNQFVYMVAEALYRLSEPALRPIRNLLPDLGGLDISPLILFFFLLFLRNVVVLGWLASISGVAGPL